MAARARALFALLAVAPFPAFAADTGPEASVPGGVQVVKAEEIGQGPEFLTATVTLTRVYDTKPRQVVRETLLRHDGRSRITQLEQGIEGRFADFALYHYQAGDIFRPLREGNMAFAYRLTMAEQITAQVRGYMPIPAEELVWRVVLKEDVKFAGHPCKLVLMGFSSGGRVFSLRWVWEARDLGGQPVRVVFPQGDSGILIVEFDEVSVEPFDPELRELPEGMPVMTGF